MLDNSPTVAECFLMLNAISRISVFLYITAVCCYRIKEPTQMKAQKEQFRVIILIRRFRWNEFPDGYRLEDRKVTAVTSLQTCGNLNVERKFVLAVSCAPIPGMPTVRFVPRRSYQRRFYHSLERHDMIQMLDDIYIYVCDGASLAT